MPADRRAVGARSVGARSRARIDSGKGDAAVWPIDRATRAWLDARGSLTRQLTAAFGPVQVQLLSQRTAPVERVVREQLRRGAGQPMRIGRCHVREVVLWAGTEPLVHARSVLPAVQSGLAWRAVRGLGTRPLADLLFGLRAAPARRLGAERLMPSHARRLVERLQRQCAWRGRPAWCRHTVFTRRGVPLLVTEWFAPGVVRRAPLSLLPAQRQGLGKACDLAVLASR